jgi:proteasome lid subunit RPN8/RPN11
MMTIPTKVAKVIRNLALKDYPHETCGALLGSNHRITEALPLPNATTEEARRRFRIRPEDYRRVEARAGATRKELIGFFHSHPDHPASPSAYDLEHAWPNLVYLIVSVTREAAGDLTAWRLSEDRSRFEPVLTR